MIKPALLTAIVTTYFSPLTAVIEDSILPHMDAIYSQEFGGKVNSLQKKQIERAKKEQNQKLRVMTYNMLYNQQDAEEKLPQKHRWEKRKPRLEEYLLFANCDLIGSQELQEDQVTEVMDFLGNTYSYYGEKTRENEGRSDVNAIFYNKERLKLLEAKTVPYNDPHYENGFTLCTFKDRDNDQKFAVINTKLTWGSPDRRLKEASQLSAFVEELPNDLPVIVMGDFNIYPFTAHSRNIFLDGDHVKRMITSKSLKEAKEHSAFGYFGPPCSINNCNKTLQPFVGPRLPGFILDHIFINDHIDALTYGIDTAKSDGEYPSDHFPVIADLYLIKNRNENL